ncbi:hypothetical protein PINS_up011016 [Pythium insidiosum]|nr:hypothetical protein PINS_up011016 [Pythium insidiosum]
MTAHEDDERRAIETHMTEENGIEADGKKGDSAAPEDVEMAPASPHQQDADSPTKDTEMISHDSDKRDAHFGEEEEDDEDDEEDIFVVVELADFKNHPILDDHQAVTIEGIDTPHPKLMIGEYSLYGQLEETVGTHYFYDTKNRTEANEYSFVGQTTRKIKFTIAPTDEYP